MASIGEAADAWRRVAQNIEQVKDALSECRFDEVVSGLKYLDERYEQAVGLTERCISPELTARVALSQAIERATLLGLGLEEISDIYHDEIDRRI